MPDERRPQDADRAEDDPEDEAHAQLAPEDLGRVARAELLEREAANDERRRLAARVAARGDDEGHEDLDGLEGAPRRLVVLEHARREDLAHEDRDEPPGALLHERPELGLEVALLRGRDGAHLLDVLALLLLEDGHDVVDGDDAEHLARRIDDRQREHVVVLEQVRDVFLIHLGRHRDDVGVHDGGDGLARAREHEVAQRDHAQQRPVGVDGVGLVDRLHLGGPWRAPARWRARR